MWFLDSFSLGNSAYNIPFAVHLAGQLNATALTRALSEIVRRHETLRTTFPLENGLPVQKIAPDTVFDLPVSDISATPGEHGKAEALRLAKAESCQPFNLSGRPSVPGKTAEA